MLDLKDRVSQLENKINNEDEIYKENLFYENQIFDGYSLGSSIKDIGKKISVMTKLTSITKEMIIK